MVVSELSFFACVEAPHSSLVENKKRHVLLSLPIFLRFPYSERCAHSAWPAKWQGFIVLLWAWLDLFSWWWDQVQWDWWTLLGLAALLRWIGLVVFGGVFWWLWGSFWRLFGSQWGLNDGKYPWGGQNECPGYPKEAFPGEKLIIFGSFWGSFFGKSRCFRRIFEDLTLNPRWIPDAE